MPSTPARAADHPRCQVPFNLTGLDLQDQYDAGFTGLYLMDTRALIGMAEVMNNTDAADELRRRFHAVNTAMLQNLWNESIGAFQNMLSTPLQPIERMAPTHFYPLLAGPELGPSETQVITTVKSALANNSRMAVWPSKTPPAALPPVYSRPLVQWYAKICDSKGDGCLDGPHALCSQLECNFDYAYGNMVQRAHAKVRYEGMALSRLDASTATIGGAVPVALYDYNCSTGGGSNGSGIGGGGDGGYVDHTIGPKDWKPVHGDGPCMLSNGPDARPALYVLPTRGNGPASAVLIELGVWYKDGDHYVVASDEGVADAKAKGYTQLETLGFVWPPPAAADASSRCVHVFTRVGLFWCVGVGVCMCVAAASIDEQHVMPWC